MHADKLVRDGICGFNRIFCRILFFLAYSVFNIVVLTDVTNNFIDDLLVRSSHMWSSCRFSRCCFMRVRIFRMCVSTFAHSVTRRASIRRRIHCELDNVGLSAVDDDACMSDDLEG